MSDEDWMPRRKHPRPPVLARAVRVLRALLGLTQVEFGRMLRRTSTTIVRYETVRPPTGKILVTLSNLAATKGFHALSRIFEIAWQLETQGMESEVIAEKLAYQTSLQMADETYRRPWQILEMYDAGAKVELRPPDAKDEAGPVLTGPTILGTKREALLVDALVNLLRSRSPEDVRLQTIVIAALEGRETIMSETIKANFEQWIILPAESASLHPDVENPQERIGERRQKGKK